MMKNNLYFSRTEITECGTTLGYNPFTFNGFMYSTTKSLGSKNPITPLELFRAINYASKYFIINYKRIYEFLRPKAKSNNKIKQISSKSNFYYDYIEEFNYYVFEVVYPNFYYNVLDNMVKHDFKDICQDYLNTTSNRKLFYK